MLKIKINYMEVKEIICPKCGNKKRIVGEYEDIKDLILTCPHCHATMKISEVLNHGNKLQKDSLPDNPHTISRTQSADDSASMTVISGEDDKSLFEHPGTLVELNTDARKKHKLKIGEQTIGREDPNNGPDIGIVGGDNKMSRRHIHIEVSQHNGYYVHKLWVDANTKNWTEINGNKLEKWVDSKETIRKEYKLERDQTLKLAFTCLKIIDE
jgi:pSer/pThr/pTyr-binding forkhead associated (FHA) protein